MSLEKLIISMRLYYPVSLLAHEIIKDAISSQSLIHRKRLRSCRRIWEICYNGISKLIAKNQLMKFD